MPRVSRNYARKDYSYLLNKLQNQRQESPVQPQSRISDCKVAPSVPVISPETRRRASLMGNKNMRYILSRITGEKHKTCKKGVKHVVKIKRKNLSS